MLDLDSGVDTAMLLRVVAERYPSVAPLLPRCGLAHKGEYVHGTQALANGDEVALIPPVSGG